MRMRTVLLVVMAVTFVGGCMATSCALEALCDSDLAQTRAAAWVVKGHRCGALIYCPEAPLTDCREDLDLLPAFTCYHQVPCTVRQFYVEAGNNVHGEKVYCWKWRKCWYTQEDTEICVPCNYDCNSWSYEPPGGRNSCLP